MFIINDMNKFADKNILVVEDSEVGRHLVLQVLTELGYTNVTAPETSVEAWDLIAQTTLDEKPFDLILTDLNMPDLDGMDLILNIKKDKLSENLKVIVISAEADPKIVELLKEIGIVGYFSKPVKKDHFKITLENVFSDKEIDPSHAYCLP